MAHRRQPSDFTSQVTFFLSNCHFLTKVLVSQIDQGNWNNRRLLSWLNNVLCLRFLSRAEIWPEIVIDWTWSNQYVLKSANISGYFGYFLVTPGFVYKHSQLENQQELTKKCQIQRAKESKSKEISASFHNFTDFRKVRLWFLFVKCRIH